MKTTRLSLTALSVMAGALLFITGCTDGVGASETDVSKVEAVAVNASGNDAVSVLIDKENKIMKADVDEMADAVFEANRAQIPADKAEAAKKDIRKSVIEQLTLQALLLRECDKAGVAVTDEECETLFNEMTGGEKSFEEVAQEANMPVEKFRDMITKNIRIEKFLTSKTDTQPVTTEADAKVRFDEIVESNPEALKTPATVEASHILISVDAEAEDAETLDAAAKVKIEEVRQKLIEGADFAEMATAYSDCPSKTNGGSLGQFGEGQMVKPFEDAAFSQEPGEIGDVVKTPFGYHVIRVDNKNPAGTITFDDVKDDIIDALAREQSTATQRDYLMELRQKAQIENFETPVVSEPVRVESKTASEVAE